MGHRLHGLRDVPERSALHCSRAISMRTVSSMRPIMPCGATAGRSRTTPRPACSPAITTCGGPTSVKPSAAERVPLLACPAVRFPSPQVCCSSSARFFQHSQPVEAAVSTAPPPPATPGPRKWNQLPQYRRCHLAGSGKLPAAFLVASTDSCGDSYGFSAVLRNTIRHALFPALLAPALLLVGTLGDAAEIRWRNPSGGTFSSAGSWFGSVAPGRPTLPVFGLTARKLSVADP